MSELPFVLRSQYRVDLEPEPEARKAPNVPPDELLPGEPGYVEGPVPPSARLGVVARDDGRRSAPRHPRRRRAPKY